MINAAICDDEEYFANKLHIRIRSFFLAKRMEFQITEYSSGKSLPEHGTDCDLLFPDVKMDDQDGFETAQEEKQMIENNLSVNSAVQIDPVKRTEPAPKAEVKEDEMIPENRDEYVPSEEKDAIGLYSVSPDEDGNPRVSSDDGTSRHDNRESDTITANTDKVDREIKALREKEQALRQRLRSADEKTAENIGRELEKLTAQLAQKDNDEYRRQNTVFS